MTTVFKLFEVGGCVRDEILGKKSKDIDFTVVFDEDFIKEHKSMSVDWFFKTMVSVLKGVGFEVFLETEECFTVRARFPKTHKHSGLTADFVMARKETGYDTESRKPKIEMGTLFDDLERRDFTVNAIAKDEDGKLIDFFGGLEDLEKGLLKTPIEPLISFLDDPLRVIRMWRFAITKGFIMDEDTEKASLDPKVWEKFEKVVSKERIREELFKMFEQDTLGSLLLVEKLPMNVKFILFGDKRLWFKPTLK